MSGATETAIASSNVERAGERGQSTERKGLDYRGVGRADAAGTFHHLIVGLVTRRQRIKRRTMTFFNFEFWLFSFDQVLFSGSTISGDLVLVF